MKAKLYIFLFFTAYRTIKMSVINLVFIQKQNIYYYNDAGKKVNVYPSYYPAFFSDYTARRRLCFSYK
jgi:hypothetical protein